MNQVDLLKLEFSVDNDKTVQNLKCKIEVMETTMKEMEVQLEKKEKETSVSIVEHCSVLSIAGGLIVVMNLNLPNIKFQYSF